MNMMMLKNFFFPENKELKPLYIHNEEIITNKAECYKENILELNVYLKKIEKQIIIICIYSTLNNL